MYGASAARFAAARANESSSAGSSAAAVPPPLVTSSSQRAASNASASATRVTASTHRTWLHVAKEHRSRSLAAGNRSRISLFSSSLFFLNARSRPSQYSATFAREYRAEGANATAA